MRMPLRQWMLAITKYADRLLADLEGLEWDSGIKALQRGWIGRSEVGLQQVWDFVPCIFTSWRPDCGP